MKDLFLWHITACDVPQEIANHWAFDGRFITLHGLFDFSIIKKHIPTIFYKLGLDEPAVWLH